MFYSVFRLISLACMTSHCTSCVSRVCQVCDLGYGLSTNSLCETCPNNCYQCTYSSTCEECNSPYFLYQSWCLPACPTRTFSSNNKCQGKEDFSLFILIFPRMPTLLLFMCFFTILPNLWSRLYLIKLSMCFPSFLSKDWGKSYSSSCIGCSRNQQCCQYWKCSFSPDSTRLENSTKHTLLESLCHWWARSGLSNMGNRTHFMGSSECHHQIRSLRDITRTICSIWYWFIIFSKFLGYSHDYPAQFSYTRHILCNSEVNWRS